MSTAQVALELVVAGVLGLLVVLLPFLGPGCGIDVASSALAVPALGIAYVLGVVFDKAFDQALRHDEASVRWHVAREPASTPTDPFPQDSIEARVRAGDASAWMGYLRARTRLARALAVSAPLVGAALSLSLARGSVACSAMLDRMRWADVPWIGLVPTVGLVLAVAAAGATTPKRTESPEEPSRAPHLVVLVLLHACAVIAVFAAVVESSGPAITVRVTVALLGSALGFAATWAHAALQRTYCRFLRSTHRAPTSKPPSTELAAELEPEAPAT